MKELDILQTLSPIGNTALNTREGRVVNITTGQTRHWSSIPAYREQAEQVTEWQTQLHPDPYVTGWAEVRLTQVMPATIIGLISSPEFAMNPYEINNGHCQEFADRLHDQVGGELLGIDNGSISYFNAFPNHLWVCVNGIHYDAEAPYGEIRWWELPIYRRMAS